MSEITLTESQARRSIAAVLAAQIKELSSGQPELRAMSRKSSKNQDPFAYDRRIGNRKKLRCLHLAYAFLRGVPYEKLERKCNEEPPYHVAMRTIIKGIDVEGYNSDHRKTFSEEWARWKKGEKQAFFLALEAARAEAVRAVAE